ncbi:MAG TPA: hypothetical protein P5246_05390 [Candidatus Omnitrophota bacterium]|nr:hypothetical protein [Candidatus Omnitrophota bacterium]
MRGFREFFSFSIAAGLVVSLTWVAYGFISPAAGAFGDLYASRFSTARSYKQVIPYFFEIAGQTISESGRDVSAIGDWADDIEGMLPEFLSDMILVQQAMSEQDLAQASIHPVQAFSDKWSSRLASCPDCEDLIPILKPLVDELFEEFPNPIWATSHIPPLGYNFEPYRRIARWNPWGMGAFYGLEWPDNRQKARTISEVSRERTDLGIRNVFIIERNVVEMRNQEQIFHEHIFNDQVVSVGVIYDPVSILHQILEDLIADQKDPELIRALSRIVDIADESIAEAKANGLMDEDTYNYLYDPAAVLNRIIQNKHPLMDAPYNTAYKVAEFYPLPAEQEE